MRTLDEALQASMAERMDRILGGVAAAFRGSHELDYRIVYPPVVNDGPMTDLVRREAAQVVGAENVFEVPAAMGSDDMAFFLREVPGSYFLVGAGNRDRGLAEPHHNSRFDIDEEALSLGAETLLRVARAFLSGNGGG